MAQAAMTVRMDKDLKFQFEELCDEFGMSINTAINVFVRAVINRRGIPFEIIDSKKAASKEALKTFYLMRQQVASRNEPEMTLEEINAEIAAARAESKPHKQA